MLSHVWLCDPVDVSCQSSLSLELLFPSPRDITNPETASLAFPALAGGFYTAVPTGKPLLPFWWSFVVKTSQSLISCFCPKFHPSLAHYLFLFKIILWVVLTFTLFKESESINWFAMKFFLPFLPLFHLLVSNLYSWSLRCCSRVSSCIE